MTEQAPGPPPEHPATERPAVAPATEPGTSTTAQPRTAADIPQTRTSLAFKSLIAGAIVLILLLVFILENTERVKITYFGAGFHLPLGVALLLAAIGGALVVGIVGTARIVQMRRHIRRHTH